MLGPTSPGVGLWSNHDACIGSETGGTSRLPFSWSPVGTSDDSAEIDGTVTRVGVEAASGAGELKPEGPDEFIPTTRARPTRTTIRPIETFVIEIPDFCSGPLSVMLIRSLSSPCRRRRTAHA